MSDDPSGAGQEQPVFDIHVPGETPTHWRDVLIHLAIITIGLFIALSLEGCVEWMHHRHLVHEARENIRTEIEDNQKTLKDVIAQIHTEQAQVKTDIAALTTLRKNLKAHGLSVVLHLSTSNLANASWDTARETGALSYMGYPEVKQYAEIYRSQQTYETQTDRITGVYTNAFSVLYIFDVDDKESANTQRTDITDALQKLLAVQSELMVYESTVTALQREYADTLKQHF